LGHLRKESVIGKDVEPGEWREYPRLTREHTLNSKGFIVKQFQQEKGYDAKGPFCNFVYGLALD
jgi:hypothetical protein